MPPAPSWRPSRYLPATVVVGGCEGGGRLGDARLLREPKGALPGVGPREAEQLRVQLEDLQPGERAREERAIRGVADPAAHLEQLGVLAEEAHLA